MSTVINVLIIVFVALGAYAGWRKGLIKSLVNLIGLVAIVIISNTLRYYVAEFLIDKLPFFNFAGYEGLTALTIVIYNVLAFVFIFIMLYCVLNIILAITGFIDTLLKFTVIWIIPSKIGGAIIGFLEAWTFVFILLFALASFNVSAKWIIDSNVSNFILDRTPIIGNYLYGVTTGAREIYKNVRELQQDETKTTKDINVYILQTSVNYGLITVEKAQELIDTGKLDVGKVTIMRPVNA